MLHNVNRSKDAARPLGHICRRLAGSQEGKIVEFATQREEISIRMGPRNEFKYQFICLDWQ